MKTKVDVECLVMTHFENILEAVARVRRLFKLKMCLHFSESAWVLYFYPVWSCPVRPSKIYFLFIDFCSAYKFFNAWLVLVDYADVPCICKSFEPSRSATNLCQAIYL